MHEFIGGRMLPEEKRGVEPVKAPPDGSGDRKSLVETDKQANGGRSATGAKVRVIVYSRDQKQGNAMPKALIVNPEGTWEEFLEAAARKLGLSNADHVETIQGACVEQLEEILQGDCLVISSTKTKETGGRFAAGNGGVEPHDFVRAHAAAAEKAAAEAARAGVPPSERMTGAQQAPKGAKKQQRSDANLPATTGCTLDKETHHIGHRLAGMVDPSEMPGRRGAGVDEGFLTFANVGGGISSTASQGQHWGDQGGGQRFSGSMPGGGVLMPDGTFPFGFTQPPQPPMHHIQNSFIPPQPNNPFLEQHQQHQQFNFPLPSFSGTDMASFSNVSKSTDPGFSSTSAVTRARRQERAQNAIAQLRHQAMILSSKAAYPGAMLPHPQPPQQQAQPTPAVPPPSLKRSHEQARFSPLVQVLRDHMVRTGHKEVPPQIIEWELQNLMGPDWRARLSVQDTLFYISEAEKAGLVEIQKVESGGFAVSVRGSRQVGVVKWVKESYGFIQSAQHQEDLFYHSSEVRAYRSLESKDEVEFLVVRNPFTGKLNATQIHLLHPDDSLIPQHTFAGSSSAATNPPQRKRSITNENGDVSIAAIALLASPPNLDEHPPHQPWGGERRQLYPGSVPVPAMVGESMVDYQEEAIRQLHDKMSCMGFSPEQIDDSIRSMGGGMHAFNTMARMRSASVPCATPHDDDSLDFDFDLDSNRTSPLESNKEPWLYKTKICKYWPQCPRGNKCWFAHGEDEMRKPNSAAFMITEQISCGSASPTSEHFTKCGSTGSTNTSTNGSQLTSAVGAAEFTPLPSQSYIFGDPLPDKAAACLFASPTDVPMKRDRHQSSEMSSFFPPCPPEDSGLVMMASGGESPSASPDLDSPDNIPWGHLDLEGDD